MKPVRQKRARRNVPEFRNNANPIPVAFLGCTLLRTVSIHKVKPGDQAKLFLMAKNPKCGDPGKPIRPVKKKKADLKPAV